MTSGILTYIVSAHKMEAAPLLGATWTEWALAPALNSLVGSPE